jgi:NADH-ubiquinone oxidoreductase chain 2
MIFISILILIVAIALPSFKKQLSPINFTRISSIIFIYAGALSLNALYIQSIGSGIGIYSGLFHVTIVSQLLEVFLLTIGSIILISWPLKKNTLIRLTTSSHKKNSAELKNNNLDYSDDQYRSSGFDTLVVNEKEIKTNISYGTEYSLIVLFSTLGASLLLSSSDLISMYLSIELQSFGVYILATLFRDSESATSAGLKYFLLGGLSSCLILLGAGFIYTFTGLTNFESLYSLISVSDSNNIIQGLNLGFIFIFVGLLFKIAAAPLHFWAPDVYDDSPTIVTIWLTIMPKISIIILLLELQTKLGIVGELTSISFVSNLDLLNSITFQNTQIQSNLEGITLLTGDNKILTIGILLNILLLISSLLSLIIGTIVGLAQTHIKRLLAYSTISHIGFILLALGINSEQSIDSLIFYIIQYTLTNLNVFLILIALGYTINSSIIPNFWDSRFNSRSKEFHNVRFGEKGKEKDINLISELKGQYYSNPLLSISFTICLFSMAGIPPLIGFFSKQFVLYSAIQQGYYFMSILAILASVISASYYLKIIRVLHTNPDIGIPYPQIPSIGIDEKKNILKSKNELFNYSPFKFYKFDVANLITNGNGKVS